jgi:hypothetical protein
METIARTLAGFAKEALARAKQRGLECPGRIRIFCQKKRLVAASSAKPYSGAHAIGGWGYFMIERGKDLPPDSSAPPHNDIDLYLYKEGE